MTGKKSYGSNHRSIYLHDIWPTRFFVDGYVPSDWFRFAIVRDPVERLLSHYIYSMADHGRLLEATVGQTKGLSATPDIATFITNLPAYRQVSLDIRHHTNPQWYYLGRDPECFSRIYNLNNVSELASELSDRCNKKIDLAHHHKTVGVHKTREYSLSLPTELREHLLDFYAEDYRIFGKYLTA